MSTRITHNPTDINDTLDGRSASYYGGTAMATWFWTRLPSDPKGVDGYRLNGSHLVALRHVANGYYAERPA